MLPSNQGKDLDRAGTLCLELEGPGRWLAQELCFLWEQGLGMTWAGTQQLLAPDPKEAFPTLKEPSRLPLSEGEAQAKLWSGLQCRWLEPLCG